MLAPNQSTTTTGSSPTTQASWPLGSEVTDNETWLESVLEQGQREGTLHVAGSASEAAQMIVSGLEGAMLVARSYGDVARFQAAASRLLASVA